MVKENRFSSTSISKFESALNQQEEWQSEISLKELIEGSIDAIERARSKKASWDQIAKALQISLELDTDINPNTIRNYYADISLRRSTKQSKKPAKKVTNNVQLLLVDSASINLANEEGKPEKKDASSLELDPKMPHPESLNPTENSNHLALEKTSETSAHLEIVSSGIPSSRSRPQRDYRVENSEFNFGRSRKPVT